MQADFDCIALNGWIETSVVLFCLSVYLQVHTEPGKENKKCGLHIYVGVTGEFHIDQAHVPAQLSCAEECKTVVSN